MILLILFMISPQQYAISFLDKFTELCHVCRSGQLDLLKEFIYFHREMLHYQHPPKFTSILHEAVEGDQPDVIQLLLLHGFNPNVRARGDLTPLHLAVLKGHDGCVRALIENGADVTLKDDQGQDAAAKAEQHSKRRESILKLLRSKGMSIVL